MVSRSSCLDESLVKEYFPPTSKIYHDVLEVKFIKIKIAKDAEDVRHPDERHLMCWRRFRLSHLLLPRRATFLCLRQGCKNRIQISGILLPTSVPPWTTLTTRLYRAIPLRSTAKHEDNKQSPAGVGIADIVSTFEFPASHTSTYTQVALHFTRQLVQDPIALTPYALESNSNTSQCPREIGIWRPPNTFAPRIDAFRAAKPDRWDISSRMPA
ncbi:hypothetical protein AZE42_05690 [Rhizopogon vesiculosus]|uniref:Uncharacterized protein n=1 Tax=Rhizopogon vesiculosus TaxID=180088 RepID=A0A1J8QHR9_9AGAM|nr:hypothetical protein AZE42_05690 [Rhizopogon vesiculosus]